MTEKNTGGRARNAKRNIIYGLMQVTVSQILPFITRTILIYRFGVDYLGLNSLFASILSVLSLMELGFGTAVVYSMYKPASEGDTEQICAYLTYYRTMYRAIGTAILLAGLSLLPFLKWFVHDPVLPGDLNLQVCYLIFLSDTVISYLLYGYLTAIPTAYQRRDILSKVDMGMSFVQCSVKSFILLTSNNFYAYLISIPLLTVVRNLAVAYTVRKQYPELRCRGNITSDQKHDLNRKVYGLMIGKVTAVSRNSIDSLCISAFVGLAANGMYNNYLFIMSSIIAFSVMVLNSMMAGVGNSIASESREKNYTDMRLFDFIYTSIAGWAAVCMLCLYQPFIKTWLGNERMLELPVVIGLCIYFYILKSGDIRYVYHEGRGLWYEGRFIMIGEAMVNILLNTLLCRYMGVFGIVLATVISVFITNFYFSPKLLFHLYFQNGKMNEYLDDHIQYAGTMILTAAVSWLLCEGILPLHMVIQSNIGNSIVCLCGRLVFCTLSSITIFWLLWHRSKRYTDALNWLKRVVKA